MEYIWADDGFVETLDSQSKCKTKGSIDEISDYGRINLVDSLLSVENNNAILDIGCGEGVTLQRYHNAQRLVGIDVSNTFCRNAKKM